MRVMIDIETMGTGPQSAVVAIGACTFDGAHTFYKDVDLQSCLDAGLRVDGSTIYWWLGQSEAARAALFNGRREPIATALSDLTHWWVTQQQSVDYEPSEVWAFPPSFDLVILENAYRALGESVPWNYRSPRCLRTLAALRPDVPKPENKGTKHNALDDALFQAAWARAMLQPHA